MIIVGDIKCANVKKFCDIKNGTVFVFKSDHDAGYSYVVLGGYYINAEPIIEKTIKYLVRLDEAIARLFDAGYTVTSRGWIKDGDCGFFVTPDEFHLFGRELNIEDIGNWPSFLIEERIEER